MHARKHTHTQTYWGLIKEVFPGILEESWIHSPVRIATLVEWIRDFLSSCCKDLARLMTKCLHFFYHVLCEWRDKRARHLASAGKKDDLKFVQFNSTRMNPCTFLRSMLLLLCFGAAFQYQRVMDSMRSMEATEESGAVHLKHAGKLFKSPKKG